MRRQRLTPEQEEKWNRQARYFVEAFQKVFNVHGNHRTDSLAGLRTFSKLRELDTEKRISDEQWADLLREHQWAHSLREKR